MAAEAAPTALAFLKARVLQMTELAAHAHETGEIQRGVKDRGIVAIVDQDKLRRILSIMLDEKRISQFFGIRALSRYIKSTLL